MTLYHYCAKFERGASTLYSDGCIETDLNLAVDLAKLRGSIAQGMQLKPSQINRVIILSLTVIRYGKENG